MTKEDLLNGNIIKGLFRITIPLIFLNLINTLYSIVDTYFVGRIGELQMGAVSLVDPIVACANSFSEGLCAAGMAMISQMLGKGDTKKAKDISTILISFGLVLGIVMGGIILVFGKEILVLLSTPEDIFEDTYRYLFGISFYFVFLFIINMYQAICTANGDSKSGVLLNTAAAVLNCILDPLFIFVFDMGIFGAALATTISKGIVTPIALYSLHRKGLLDLKHYHFDLSLIKEIVIIAIPSSVGYFLTSFGFVLMQKEIAAYGSIALSAYSVGNKLSSLYYIFINCWGSGLTTFVGASIGAEKTDRAKKCYRSCLSIVAGFATVFIPIGLLTSAPLLRMFAEMSDELFDLALEYAYFSIFTSFFMGWFNSLNGLFNGSGNTLISMILSGSRIWFIRIPLIKLLNHFTSFGPTNIWIAMNLSNFIVCLAGLFFYLFYPWEKRKLKI